MKKVYLKPGEIELFKEPTHINAIVDESVAVAIWDRQTRIGGMCHFLFPKRDKHLTPDNIYGEHAVINLLRMFKNSGSSCSDLLAKIVGGAKIKTGKNVESKEVGSDNVRMAESVLQKFRIFISGQRVGGKEKKRVVFDTSSGDIRLQRVAADVHSGVIRVLIVDASRPIRMLLRKMIESSPKYQVVGDTSDFNSAKLMVQKLAPDLVTLELTSPEGDPIGFLKFLKEDKPTPSLIVTELENPQGEEFLKAMSLGAFDYIQKPTFELLESLTFDLQEKAEVAVQNFQKSCNSSLASSAHRSSPQIRPNPTSLNTFQAAKGLVLIGASTGGTETLRQILAELPPLIPPILIVQHMPPFFTAKFAESLAATCRFKVVEAKDKMPVEIGTAYVAPGGMQMGLVENLEGHIHIVIKDDPPVNRFKPSVDYLFSSVSKMRRKKVLGILLTGMGNDGAKGLKLIRGHRGHTIAQDEESSIVYGMPKAAMELGAAIEQKSKLEIAKSILLWANKL